MPRRQLHFLAALAAVVTNGTCAPAQEQPAPNKVALLVGVNQYDKPIFSRLNYAERDVEELAAEFRRLAFEVTLLKGSADGKDRATRQNIVDTLNRLVEPLGAADVMVVMLSGHGQQFEATRADGTKHDDAFYCPVDAVSNKPETLISLSYVIDDVLAPNVGRKLLLVDACRDAPKDPGRGSRGIQGRVIALPEDTAVLFSCRAGQQSWENDDLQHGLFTYCVLEALKGEGARDQDISWTDVVAYVNRRMAAQEMRDRMPRPQEPIPAGGVPYTVLGRIGQPATLVAPFTQVEAASARAMAARSLRIQETVTNSIGMKLVLIPAGEFPMGSTAGQVDQLLRLDPSFKREHLQNEQPQQQVRISQPFYLGIHEVTVGQFRQFVNAAGYRTTAETDGEGGYGWNDVQKMIEGPAPRYTWRNTGFAQNDSYPVVNVTWHDVVAFCTWLSRKEGAEYGLPTEAQWEYACRSGTTSLWSQGDDPESLARVGNVADATAKTLFANWNTIAARDGHAFTAPVGTFEVNGFGVHDMHGNVSEWCLDWFDADEYAKRMGRITVDPLVAGNKEDLRILRGGAWSDYAAVTRSASRDWYFPNFRCHFAGFRVTRRP